MSYFKGKIENLKARYNILCLFVACCTNIVYTIGNELSILILEYIEFFNIQDINQGVKKQKTIKPQAAETRYKARLKIRFINFQNILKKVEKSLEIFPDI